MVNRKSSRTRRTGLRDPSLIVIAAEGVKTEVDYFRGIAEKTRDSRLKILVLNRVESGNSSPLHVFYELKKYKAANGINSHDELCMVVDRDANSTSEAQLSQVAQLCFQNNYLLAVSNPSFELWLYLHFKCALELSQSERDELVNLTGSEFKPLISSICPEGYSYTNLQIHRFWENIEDAIEHSKRLDGNPADRWPITLGTRVHLIVEKIMKKYNQTA